MTATSTTNAVSTAYFALDNTYGNFQGVQGTGAVAYQPYGDAKGVGQTAEVLDNLGNSGEPAQWGPVCSPCVLPYLNQYATDRNYRVSARGTILR